MRRTRGTSHAAEDAATPRRSQTPSDEGAGGREIEDLSLLHERLRAGTAAIGNLAPSVLVSAWNRLIEDALEPRSSFWDPAFENAVSLETGMHPKTLHASLRAGLGGLELSGLGGAPRGADPSRSAGPVAAVLAGNVPVLAPQVLRAAVICRRGALIKPASDSPSFTERFVATLQRNLEIPEAVYLTASWRGGGRQDLELVRSFDQIAVYGGVEAVDRFRALQRWPGQIALFGPKYSVGVLAGGASHDLQRLARDVALFDQRGCLSVRVVYLLDSGSPPAELGAELSRALERLADDLPPSGDLADSSAARQWLDVARLTGRQVFGIPGRSGVVLDEIDSALPPGGRSVSLRPTTTQELLDRLRADRRLIQGLAWSGAASLPQAVERLAGEAAWRVAEAGQLQEAGPEWVNGGIDLIDWFASKA